MSSSYTNDNLASNPGTGINFWATGGYNKKERGDEPLLVRVRDQQAYNSQRWLYASISQNFRSGSYDGTNRQASEAMIRNKTEFVFNLIDKECLRVSGYQRNNRKDFELKALNDEYSRVCDQRNAILKYIGTKNHLQDIFSQACDAAMTQGFVLVEPYIEPTPYLKCNIKWKIHHSCDFIIDSNFREDDLSDCAYIATNQIVPSQEAEILFPEVDKDIIWSGIPASTNSMAFYFQPNNKGLTYLKGHTAITRLWQRKNVKRYFLLNENTGELIPCQNKVDPMVLGQLSMRLGQPISLEEFSQTSWGLSIYINYREVISNIENPLGVTQCPCVPIFWQHRASSSIMRLRYLSLPMLLQDPQYLSDQLMGKTLDATQGRAQSGFQVPMNSLMDEDQLKKADNVAIIYFDPEKGPAIPIEPTQTNPVTLAAFETIRKCALEACPFGTAPQEDKRALAPKSGVATMLDQADNLVSLKPILDGWDKALRLLGDLTDQIVFWNMSKTEAQRILGKENPIDPRFFNYSEGAVSMGVAPGLYTDTQQKAEFAQWLEFCQLTGTQLPAEAWAKVAPLMKKDEVLSILKAQQEAQMKAQQEAAEYENALKRAQLNEFNSKAYDNIALAKEREARAAANIGLLDERESEIEKNKSVSVKNIIDSVVALSKAETEMGQASMDKAEAKTKEAYKVVDQENKQNSELAESKA